jgi:hypothetical protein
MAASPLTESLGPVWSYSPTGGVPTVSPFVTKLSSGDDGEPGWNSNVPSACRHPAFSPRWTTSTSSTLSWPVSAVHRRPVAGSNDIRYGLRKPYAQISSAPRVPTNGLSGGIP